MSHIVKHSDLTHLFTGGLYSGFREALNGEEPPLRGENDFLVEQARLFEERINTKLELFGPRGGVNFSGYNSDGCLVPKRNVRMIAERSGDNPATKIFLTVYETIPLFNEFDFGVGFLEDCCFDSQDILEKLGLETK